MFFKWSYEWGIICWIKLRRGRGILGYVKIMRGDKEVEMLWGVRVRVEWIVKFVLEVVINKYKVGEFI